MVSRFRLAASMFGSTSGETPESERRSKTHAIIRTSYFMFMRLAVPAQLLPLRLESSRIACGGFMSGNQWPNTSLERTAFGCRSVLIRQATRMRRRPIFPRSLVELEALSTKQLLGRLRQLHQCEESLALSDRDVADDSGRIEFKQSPEWISAFRDVKQVLSRREHVPKKK